MPQLALGTRLRGGLEGDAGDEDGGLGTTEEASVGAAEWPFTAPTPATDESKVVAVTEKFMLHECLTLPSYLPHLQQYQVFAKKKPLKSDLQCANQACC